MFLQNNENNGKGFGAAPVKEPPFPGHYTYTEQSALRRCFLLSRWNAMKGIAMDNNNTDAQMIVEESRQVRESVKEEKTDEKKLRRQKLHKQHMRALKEILIRLALLCLVLYILLFHLVGITKMPSGDMYPRIDAGDMIVFYRLERNIHAQDIIVFEKPSAALEQSYLQNEGMHAELSSTKAWWRRALDWLGFKDPADPPKTLFVCRVVAGPGDTVEITDKDNLMVNGNNMIESNIFYPTPLYEGFMQYPLTLGDGEYFVLADYRNGGADSRFFGAVRTDEILGTVITIARRNNL